MKKKTGKWCVCADFTDLNKACPKDSFPTRRSSDLDVFAWDAYEAPRVDPNFICHHLNANPYITPRRQPLQRPSKEHVEAIKNEVTKLKQAGAIKEVFYPQWLANTVVVKKKIGKWRVCVLYRSQ